MKETRHAGVPRRGIGTFSLRRRELTVVFAAVLALLLVLSWSSCFAYSDTGASPAGKDALATATGGGKVLLVIIDRIGIDDVTESSAPNLMKLMARGSTSLMNARVKYDQYGLGSYVVIGSGGRALGGPNAGLSFNFGERLKAAGGGTIRAGDIYDARTGLKARPGQVLNLSIEEMKKKSDTTQATSVPGLLGQALRQGHKRITVLGNADSLIPTSPIDVPPIPGQQQLVPPALELAEPQAHASDISGQYSYPLTSFVHREAVCIAMDERGMVPAGDVSSALVGTYSPREGARTDFAALERQAAALMPVSDVMVVDTGQTTRVDEQADFFTADGRARARATALKESDASLGRLQGLVDLNKDLIVVCTPTPTQKMIDGGEFLTPLVLAGKGFNTGGQLRSATTRRTGLVSNFDIAPTVVAFTGLKVPGGMDGRALTSAGTSTDLAALKTFRDQAVSAFNSRKALVRVYVITSMCVIALFFLVILIRRDTIKRHPYFWATALMAILAGPFVWLAVSAMGAVAQGVVITVAICASILIALLSLLIRDRRGDVKGAKVSATMFKPMLAVSGVTLLVIMLDPILGSPLMTFSAFGSDVIMGDRYYGIGNLFFGFALGAAILFTCLAIQTRDKGIMSYLRLDKPWKRYAFAAVVLGIVAVIDGFPKLGADFGGLVAVVVAGLVTILRLEGKPLTARKIAIVVLVLILCVGGLLVLDAVMPGSASHAGRAIGKVKASGLSSLVSQVSRKLGGNWTLTWTSTWRLLLLFGLVAWLIFNWRFGILKYVKEHYPYMNAGFWGLVVGLIVAWIFNDSGIESAAAISVFLFVPYFVMLVPWKRKDKALTEKN
ncbi:MAG: hypothetical protein ACYC99_00510 [Candidatus Geothermincolia bacterium]